MLGRIAWVGILAVVVLAPSDARAHHVISDNGIAPVMPHTVASLDIAAATFDVAGRAGSWESVTPSLEWGFGRHFSLFAALPLAQVVYDGGPRAWGFGDLALSAKVGLFETPHGGLLLAAGLGAELPTGGGGQGLGAGHVELSPFLAASTVLHDGVAVTLLAYAMASFLWPLEAGHHHASGTESRVELLGSVLAPHGESELFGRLMAAAVMGSFYVAAGPEGAAVVRGENEGQLATRFELGWNMMSHVRLFVAGDVTVLGERRYGVRARAGAAWMY